MRITRYLIKIILCTLLSASAAYADEYKIVVSKKNKQMTLEKAGTVVKKYTIATGKGGQGTKRRRGDSKTPIGTYRISRFRESSRFHYFIQLDYPNLIDAWHGYKNRVIDADEFKQIAAAYKNRKEPPQDTELGGFIGIHGLGETNEKKLTIHQELNWTEGCIALTNGEINDLRKYIDIGTQVIIRE